MKRFLLLMIILFIPLVVCADQSLNVYNAKVINKNGIEYLKYEGGNNIKRKIPFNSIITLSKYEYSWFNEDEQKEYNGSSIMGYYNGESFEVNLNDLEINKENYSCYLCNKEELYIYDIFINTNFKESLKVLSLDGIDMLSGPADDFKKMSNIPNNTEFKANYIIGIGGLDDIAYWANINYNNENGFIKLYKSDKIFGKADFIYLTTKKVNILFDGKLVGEIPANTQISPNYIDLSYDKSYINYNGVSGFINQEDLAYGFDRYIDIMINYDHKLYSTANKKSNVITTVPANTKISFRYNYYREDDNYIDCVFTTYNNVDGWICFDEGEKPKYVEHKYPWSYATTTTTTTKKIEIDESLVSNNVLKSIMLSAGLIFVFIVVMIIINEFKKNKIDEKEIEKISKIEEDKD